MHQVNTSASFLSASTALSVPVGAANITGLDLIGA